MNKKINRKKWQIPAYKINQFFSKKTKYCIAIPVINEGSKIKKELEEIKKYAKVADILILDGGSTDNSVNVDFLKRTGVRVLITSQSGQGRQLRAGLSYALNQGYKGIITIDGNGKDDVKAVTQFIKALNEGYDFVQGSRFIKGGYHENTPLDRLLIARGFISPLLSWAAGYWYTDTPNAFRAYSKKYLLHPQVNPFRNVFVRYELLFYLSIRANRLGLKTKEIPVIRCYPRGFVPTKIVGFKRVFDVINIIKIALGFYNP